MTVEQVQRALPEFRVPPARRGEVAVEQVQRVPRVFREPRQIPAQRVRQGSRARPDRKENRATLVPRVRREFRVSKELRVLRAL